MPLLKSSSSSLRRAGSSSDKQLDTAARARPFQELSQSLALFLSTLFPFRITAIRPRWFFARSLLPLASFSASHFSQRLRQFLLQAALPTELSLLGRSAGPSVARSASCSTKRPPVTEDPARRSGKT